MEMRQSLSEKLMANEQTFTDPTSPPNADLQPPLPLGHSPYQSPRLYTTGSNFPRFVLQSRTSATAVLVKTTAPARQGKMATSATVRRGISAKTAMVG